MDRRNFLKAGLLGTVTSGLPVAKAEAVENLRQFLAHLGCFMTPHFALAVRLVSQNVSK